MQHDLKIQEIPGLYTVYILLLRKTRHPINIPTSIPSCTTGGTPFRLFWRKGRFPQMVYDRSHGARGWRWGHQHRWCLNSLPGAGWMAKNHQEKKTVKYLIQVLGTDSSEVQSPKCASSFKLSSINQAKESIRTQVIDEYLWHLSPKYRSL